jgi:hypothetical protein
MGREAKGNDVMFLAVLDELKSAVEPISIQYQGAVFSSFLSSSTVMLKVFQPFQTQVIIRVARVRGC